MAAESTILFFLLTSWASSIFAIAHKIYRQKPFLGDRSELTVIQCICGEVRHELCGGASLEATLEEVLEVLHDRVNNVGGKVLMVKSFF
ncbi:hypothetical protein SO802_024745 [Lithocarpus litseifolius]|uniref:Uncharacterized protein n=1 Tax=Lithocarpus litseifolius TaxID=425828 RepID=A0AAW2CCM1_9ROSI